MSITSKLSRVLTLACTAILASTLMIGLTACSNDEQAIKDGISTELGAFKNPTKESLEPYVGQLSSSDLKGLETYGIDIYEFLGHCFSKFDYSVGKVSASGDTATAELSLTNVDVQSAVKATSDEFQSSDMRDELAQIYTDGGETALIQKFFEMFYSKLDETTETVSNDVTVKLTKSNGSWTIDDASLNDLVSAAYGGADFSSML